LERWRSAAQLNADLQAAGGGTSAFFVLIIISQGERFKTRFIFVLPIPFMSRYGNRQQMIIFKCP
jgi:hypothetical protein